MNVVKLRRKSGWVRERKKHDSMFYVFNPMLCGITKTHQNRISGRHAEISQEDAAKICICKRFVFLSKLEMCRLLSHVEAQPKNVDGTEWKGLQDVGGFKDDAKRSDKKGFPILQWLLGGAH